MLLSISGRVYATMMIRRLLLICVVVLLPVIASAQTATPTRTATPTGTATRTPDIGITNPAAFGGTSVGHFPMEGAALWGPSGGFQCLGPTPSQGQYGYFRCQNLSRDVSGNLRYPDSALAPAFVELLHVRTVATPPPAPTPVPVACFQVWYAVSLTSDVFDTNLQFEQPLFQQTISAPIMPGGQDMYISNPTPAVPVARSSISGATPTPCTAATCKTRAMVKYLQRSTVCANALSATVPIDVLDTDTQWPTQ